MRARRWNGRSLNLPLAMLLLVVGVATLSPDWSLRAADKPVLSIDDLYRIDAPSNVTVAADGKSAIYVRRWHDRETRQVRQSLWRVTGDDRQAQPLEAGEPDARDPVISPDGRWLAFLSSRPLPDGSAPYSPVPAYTEKPAEIWVMPAAGGKAVPLGGNQRPYGRVYADNFYANVAFSADSKRLVFVADDGSDPRTESEIANDVQIVREDQGEGYEGYGPAQIWIADLAPQGRAASTPQRFASAFTRITEDDVWYGDPQWTPDGKSLIVCANRTGDRESVRYSINKNFDLWCIDLDRATSADDGEAARVNGYRIQQLTSGPGPEVSPRLSPDGRRLLCMSCPRKGSHFDVFNLLVVNLASAGPDAELLFDHHAPQVASPQAPDSPAQQPPHLPPAFPLPRDCWLSATSFVYSANDRTTARRQAIDLAEGIAALSDEAMQKQIERHAPALAARAAWTPVSNAFLKDRTIAVGEVVRWKSFDNREIEGILTPPADPDARKPYPLVVFPHGGPHGRSTRDFDFTVQTFAAHGYAVFQPNFRGSAGYGQEFIEADRFDLGGGDMRDILTGIEHLVREDLVDAKRQFIYGSSYGGFTTCWLIGHTNQFRAAVPMNAVTDLTMMWGLTDIQSWTEWEFGGRPWETAQAMREHSPLTYAANVRTPTLILHAAGDRRCPLPMGRAFYRALKSCGVETQMVIYPGEGHPIKQLPHIEDVLTRTLAWFKQHDHK